MARREAELARVTIFLGAASILLGAGSTASPFFGDYPVRPWCSSATAASLRSIRWIYKADFMAEFMNSPRAVTALLTEIADRRCLLVC